MHAGACKGPRARAYTQICNIYCFSTATMIRESASLLRYGTLFVLLMLRQMVQIPQEDKRN